MIHKAIEIYRARGWRGCLGAVSNRVGSSRKRCMTICRHALTGVAALEIGGPSSIFMGGGLLPVYRLLASVDNCNYAATTQWQARAETGPGTYRYEGASDPGTHFISEATCLESVDTAKYDVLICSHVLEHLSNPLKALNEWRRVVKTGGILLIVVPCREGGFDHKRSVTMWSHLLDDFHGNVGEEDLTHLPEILKLHDLSRDPGAGTLEAFRTRSQRNIDNRCLHHHVFNEELVGRSLEHAGCQVLALERFAPDDLVVIARTL